MISFVYFDMGGVVIKDFSQTNKWQEMLEELGVNQTNRPALDKLFNQYERTLCVGCRFDDLIPLMRSRIGLTIPAGYSLMADMVSRFECNPSIWPVIDTNSRSRRIGLLTNMYPGMLAAINTRDLLPPATWDVIIDSSIVKLQKPDPKIYELAQRQAGVPAEEILFIDNTPENLIPPRQLGWQTYLYDSSDYAKASRVLAEHINSVL